MADDRALQAARERRKRLYESMVDLEHAVQSPYQAGDWLPALRTELDDVATALDGHITTVEADDGIIERVVNEAPRLDNRAAWLREDHGKLQALLAETLDEVAAVAPPLDPDVVDELRRAVLELLGALSRHRQRGSDFVWEGYDVDIGGPA